MDFVTVLIVLAVAAIVIYVPQIVAFKLFIGEADDAFEGRSSFNVNPRRLFCKAMVQKLKVYPHIHSMRYLAFYMNFCSQP